FSAEAIFAFLFIADSQGDLLYAMLCGSLRDESQREIIAFKDNRITFFVRTIYESLADLCHSRFCLVIEGERNRKNILQNRMRRSLFQHSGIAMQHGSAADSLIAIFNFRVPLRKKARI